MKINNSTQPTTTFLILTDYSGISGPFVWMATPNYTPPNPSMQVFRKQLEITTSNSTPTNPSAQVFINQFTFLILSNYSGISGPFVWMATPNYTPTNPSMQVFRKQLRIITSNLTLTNPSAEAFSKKLRGIKLQIGLESWCNEKVNTPEHEIRLKVAHIIKECFASGRNELDLSFEEGLSSIPSEIGALRNLKILRLSTCDTITELPREIGALTNLNKLTLIRCSRLTQLPREIGDLKNLETLDLYGCDNLTELPPKIGALRKLRHLDLRRCFSLRSLPLSLANLSSDCTIKSANCSLNVEASQAFQNALTEARRANPNRGPHWIPTIRQDPSPL